MPASAASFRRNCIAASRALRSSPASRFSDRLIRSSTNASAGSNCLITSKNERRTRCPPSIITFASSAAHNACSSARSSSTAACSKGMSTDGLGSVRRSRSIPSSIRAVFASSCARFRLRLWLSQSPTIRPSASCGIELNTPARYEPTPPAALTTSPAVLATSATARADSLLIATLPGRGHRQRKPSTLHRRISRRRPVAGSRRSPIPPARS